MTDFLNWRSTLTLEQVFAVDQTFSYPSLLDLGPKQSFVYLSSLKDQKGRMALMREQDGVEHCITPAPFSLRTKISEYGGKPYWLFSDHFVFANQADQCLYRQYFDADWSNVSAPERISCGAPEHGLFMFTDVHHVQGDHYVAIAERQDLSVEHAENTSCLVALDASRPDSVPKRLQQGADFYSNFVIDKVRQRVAWVEWDHPNMPWDHTRLMVAGIDFDKMALNSPRPLPLDNTASVCQLMFASDGRLFFSADYAQDSANTSLTHDADNYWNLHVHDFDRHDEATRVVTHEQREYGYPHWQYGDCRIVQADGRQLICVASTPEQDALVSIDIDSLQAREIYSAESTLQSLNSSGSGDLLLIELPKAEKPRLLSFDLNSDQRQPLVLKQAASLQTRTSQAEHICFATQDGESAYGFYYPPVNQDYVAEGLAPLIVMVHGGPTARAYGHFDVQKQFWTSRGFALLDVNHRGSSGYGRNYRDALYGNWGQLDSRDIVDGIGFLIEQGKVDPHRVCIRGKSAGGYAVLRALTEFPDTFKAGACYYGIGDLATLAEITHKFEKHYTDRLIAEKYSKQSATSSSSRFHKRSPIHKVSQISSAMIIFQGADDKVVPPLLATQMVQALQAQGVRHEYHEYAGEGHGFRQTETNIDAWTRELDFYRSVLGLRQ